MYSDKLIIPKEEKEEQKDIFHTKKSDVRFALICAKELYKALYDDRTGLKTVEPDFFKKNHEDFVQAELVLETIKSLLEKEYIHLQQ